jgi:amino acid transporter
MVMLSMACDGATPAAEETRNARRTIPLAVVLTCTMVGLWYVAGYSAFALAALPADAAELTSQTYASAVTPLAGQAWGSFKMLVAITAMTAATGAAIPGAIAASRVLFAMSRDGKLPGRFSKLHPRFRSPWNALHLVYGAALLAALPALVYGPNRGIDFWAGISGWYIAIVYVSVNVASIVFFWRFRRAKFHVAWNLLVPLIGIAAQVLVIWQSIIVELWNSGTLGHCAQGLIVIVSVITAVYVGVHHVRRRNEPSPLAPEYSAEAQV